MGSRNAYAEGGGILATVRATKVRSKGQLIKATLPRVKALTREGVTTVEIKSGYGLSSKGEIKILEAARALPNQYPIKVISSLLVATALPPEFAGRTDDYIVMLCKQLIPEVAEKKLASFVDVHCEPGSFSLAQRELIFQAAADHNLPTRCHAERFSANGNAYLDARLATSTCDHLQYITEPGIADMASSGSVAILLPGSY